MIQRADGAFLLAQRPAGKVYAGYWEFPGGKFEAGEPAAARSHFRAAARRTTSLPEQRYLAQRAARLRAQADVSGDQALQASRDPQ